jgi:hypothetical protein
LVAGSNGVAVAQADRVKAAAAAIIRPRLIDVLPTVPKTIISRKLWIL